MASQPLADNGCRGPDKAFSVTLCQAAASYQATLPAALARRGMLRRVLRFGPELQILEANESGCLKPVKEFPGYQMVHRCLWHSWGLLPTRGRRQLPMLAASWLASRLISGWVPPGGIFHGLPGLALPVLQARRTGTIKATTLLENATLHPRRWQREALQECTQFNINPRTCASTLPAALIRRVERELELCDVIIVPSTTARQSFEEFGLGHKVLVVSPGVDHRFFSPGTRDPARFLFRACFVGRIELSKGIGYLLQAWKLLALPEAELVLVGPVQTDAEPLLKRFARSNVVLTGALPPSEVAKQYRSADVFIHPSANEGLGLVLLEAMACGIPVIASDRTGAEDCVTHGKNGLVIPARQVNALAEAILWCFRHRDVLPAMGRAARQKVEQHFTLSHYEQRQINIYGSLANRLGG